MNEEDIFFVVFYIGVIASLSLISAGLAFVEKSIFLSLGLDVHFWACFSVSFGLTYLYFRRKFFS